MANNGARGRRIAEVMQGSQAIKASASDAANLRRAQYDTSMPTVERILKAILPHPEQLRPATIADRHIADDRALCCRVSDFRYHRGVRGLRTA